MFVQRPAAWAIFYLTDSSIMTTLTTKQPQLQSKGKSDVLQFGGTDSLDMDRLLQSMFDHSFMSKNQALQRWSAVTIPNLVAQRSTCLAANNLAAAVASGEEYPPLLQMHLFLDLLISTGIFSAVSLEQKMPTRGHMRPAHWEPYWWLCARLIPVMICCKK